MRQLPQISHRQPPESKLLISDLTNHNDVVQWVLAIGDRIAISSTNAHCQPLLSPRTSAPFASPRYLFHLRGPAVPLQIRIFIFNNFQDVLPQLLSFLTLRGCPGAGPLLSAKSAKIRAPTSRFSTTCELSSFGHTFRALFFSTSYNHQIL